MINWDDVIDEADATPHSALAQWLGRADEIAEVVIVLRFHDSEKIHYTAITEHDRSTISLMETAKQLVFRSLEVVED